MSESNKNKTKRNTTKTNEPTEKELCVNTNSIKDSKEDTNNIPLLVSNNAITNYKYWYVIYCLLPACYSDTIL